MPKLSFHQVSFWYDRRPVLEQLDLAVEEGEFVSLIGPSGVGKSTIFQVAAGLLQPTSGAVSLDGVVTASRLGKVAYMPQRDLLMPWRTVAENAALPLEIQGVSRREAIKRVREHLPVFGLDGYAEAYPDELSGGMRQRVSLLRAILTGSDILLLDEPFSALDGITRMDMQEWLLSLWEKTGLTVLMITHDLDEAVLLADRVCIVRESPIRRAAEVDVPLPRPRRPECRHDPAFVATRERVWRLLRGDETEALQGREAR